MIHEDLLAGEIEKEEKKKPKINKYTNKKLSVHMRHEKYGT